MSGMKKRDFFKKLKEHPELFDKANDSNFSIDEKDIPPIPQWFYDIKEKEQRKKGKKRKMKALIAIPACAAIVLVLLITPLGKALADGFYKLFVH